MLLKTVGYDVRVNMPTISEGDYGLDVSITLSVEPLAEEGV
jgi:hypothetical protein